LLGGSHHKNKLPGWREQGRLAEARTFRNIRADPATGFTLRTVLNDDGHFVGLELCR
jgi:hypothetical protein